MSTAIVEANGAAAPAREAKTVVRINLAAYAECAGVLGERNAPNLHYNLEWSEDSSHHGKRGPRPPIVGQAKPTPGTDVLP